MTSLAKVNSTPAALPGSPMLCLYGQGVARGYAIGRAVVMGATALEVVHYRIAPDAIQSEKERLTRALVTTQREMQELAETLPEGMKTVGGCGCGVGGGGGGEGGGGSTANTSVHRRDARHRKAG